MSATDDQLMTAFQEGDVNAFSLIVDRYHDFLVRFFRVRGRSIAEAEDMAQEAFLKAFRLLKGFRGECSFSTWMYRVTCSVCLTELNRRKRRGEVELLPAHVGEAPSAALETSDLPEHIRRCVALLPDHYAQIITLYYLKGVNYDEIAQVMEIPMGTLKTWMFRARKQLRSIVQKEVYNNA